MGSGQTTYGAGPIATIKSAQNNVVANVSQCYIVSTDSLTTSDGVHWDDASIEELAQRTLTVLNNNALI